MIIFFEIQLNIILPFCGSLRSQVSDHLPQFLILKDCYHINLINNNDVFKLNEKCQKKKNKHINTYFRKKIVNLFFINPVQESDWNQEINEQF